MKKQGMFVVMFVLTLVSVTGCPPSEQGDLSVFMLWQDEFGREYTEQAYSFEIVDAPNGAIVEFDGGEFKSGIIEYKLSDFPKIIPQRFAVIGSKNITPLDAHLIGALVILAGHVVPTIICGDEPDRFQGIVPMGPAVETAVMQVDTSAGQFTLVLRGAAYGGNTNEGENEGEGEVDNTYTLRTSVQGQGTITGKGDGSPAGTYDAGTVVGFNANPAVGWTFVHWLVNGSIGSSNQLAQVTMDSDVDLVAVFQQEQLPAKFVLTTSVQGQGTITGKGGNPAGTYDVGEVVGVQANPASGWIFVHWLVNGSTGSSNVTAQVTMNSDVNLVAVFQEDGVIPNPIGDIKITLDWSGNSNIAFSATGAIPNKPIGLELYYTDLASSPFVLRHTFTADENGEAIGIMPFRDGAKVLRFSAVRNSVSGGGYLPHEEVYATFDGVAIPLVTDVDGNQAFQVTIR